MLNLKETVILGQDAKRVEVLTRVSTRARRITVRVSAQSGVELVIPKRVSLKKAMDFLYSKEDWILHKKSLTPEAVPFKDGAEIPIQGKIYTIRHSGELRGITHIEGRELIVSGPKNSIERKVQTFLEEMAKKKITARANIEAEKLGVQYSRITIRDTTTRWGSCSASRALSFSWRLIMAPKEVLDYVAAHEIAHIREMNHSKKFWNIVAKLYPNYNKARQWLRDQGSTLYVYG
ncbi:MAG: putative metal-dependent hydrolase [Rickettsiaceae bacterium]|jgi:predicted metal-dependent hydrolase|nr:putative metal-dependent hydrolase [Rickettsiaceae bacterium]